jgi:hypothetical protein
LDKNLQQALRQYQLISAEKELTGKNSQRCDRCDDLSSFCCESAVFWPSPTSEDFGSLKLPKNYSCPRMAVGGRFRLLLSWLPDFPEDFSTKVYQGENLTPEIEQVIAGFPKFVSNLLKDIPRLNKIRKIIEFIGLDYENSSDEFLEERKIASIIRLAQEYDRWESKGCSKGEIFERIRSILEQVFFPEY